MRHYICLSFTAVMFSISPLSAFAKDIDVTSKITAATVYNDRASVTRSAKVEIPAGAHNLVFAGLPLGLFPNSLRVEGASKASVVFGALTHKRESSIDYIIPKEKELNAQLLALQDKNKIYRADKQALQVARTFLENLGKQAVLRENEEIAKIDLNPENWGKAADSLSSKYSDNLKSSLALDIKVREANNKIRKIQNDLNQLRTGQKQSYSVVIPFESDKSSTLSVDLSYQISGVSWQPIYDARLDVKTAKLELVQYGSVWQRTGEDWEDVALTLSTAQPSRGAGLPDLQPHWLSIYAPRPRKMAAQSNAFSFDDGNFDFEKNSKAATGISSAPVPAELGEGGAPLQRWRLLQEERVERAMTKAAQINTEGFVGEYKITGLASVKSDGTKSKLLIGGFETEDSLQVQIKPQISTDAYLVVKAKLKGDAPILAGQVNLFRDGAYIGQSYMKMLRPDDETELAFGIDDNVTVKRNTLKDERSEAGLITKDSVIEKYFVTEIQNLHKEAIQIAVLETVPSSKDQRIRVEILKDKTTAGYETDYKNIKGLTRWLGALNPQQKTAIKLGWKVSWPKGDNISGL